MSKKQNRSNDNREGRNLKKQWDEVLGSAANLYRRKEQLELQLTRTLRVFDPGDLEVAVVQRDLAMVYHKLGRYREAADLMEKAVITFEEQLEYDDPALIAWQPVLGCMYQDVGRYEEAIDILEEVLEVIEDHRHPKYPPVPTILWNLAAVYRDAEQYPRAIELFTELLDRDAESLGADHPDLARRQRDLARTLRKAGLIAQAIELLNCSLEVNLASGPPHDPRVVEVTWELAIGYAALECRREALSLLDEVLEGELINKGADHIDVAYVLDFQGILLRLLGEMEKSRTKLEGAYRLFLKHLGADDENTLRVKMMLEGG